MTELPEIKSSRSHRSYSEDKVTNLINYSSDSNRLLNDFYGDYIRKKELFGIEGYKLPHTDIITRKP